MKLVGPNPSGLCMCGCGRTTKLAPHTCRRDSWVKGQPLRFIRGHATVLSTPEYEEQDRGFGTPCWIWSRALNSDGYGQKCVEGRSVAAHRIYYERACGPIPEELEIDHLCRVPACVNPEHLEAVTHVENIRRGARTKLTVAQVREIRASDEGAPALALRFGVTDTHIYYIRKGKSWKDIAA